MLFVTDVFCQTILQFFLCSAMHGLQETQTETKQHTTKGKCSQEEYRPKKQLLDEIKCLRIESNSIMAQMSNITNILLKQEEKRRLTKQTELADHCVTPADNGPQGTQGHTRTGPNCPKPDTPGYNAQMLIYGISCWETPAENTRGEPAAEGRSDASHDRGRCTT